MIVSFVHFLVPENKFLLAQKLEFICRLCGNRLSFLPMILTSTIPALLGEAHPWKFLLPVPYFIISIPIPQGCIDPEHRTSPARLHSQRF